MTGVDVCMAYLYGKLYEEIYMWQPGGFIARGQENIYAEHFTVSNRQGLPSKKSYLNP